MDEAIEAIVEVLTTTAPEIREALPGRRYRTEAENPSDEVQLAADVWADERLANRMTALSGVGAYASEEREAVIDAGGGYSVTLDPLDGSSNLRSNNAMGTILGVFDADLPASGADLVAAAYVLFGPLTTMVLAADGAVTEHLIGPDGSTRVVTDPLEIPADPVVYGFGGRVPDWTPTFEAYAESVAAELKLRYGGAMIADVNQVLTYGGVFAYPELESAPSGKLRLQFEGIPMAHIVESAGGRSSDGDRSLLEVEPADLHGRTPVYLGNAELIERREAA